MELANGGRAPSVTPTRAAQSDQGRGAGAASRQEPGESLPTAAGRTAAGLT